MSLTTSLNNAYSGLTASSRHAELIASNVSSSLVDGYTRKSLELSSSQYGGVKIEGVNRAEDPPKTAARRLIDANLGNSSTLSSALTRSQEAYGLPGNAGSLGSLSSDFEASLRGLSNAPASTPDARSVLNSALSYAEKFNAISAENATLRTQADAAIAQDVTTLNQSLEKIKELNAEIVFGTVGNQDVTALQDQRALLVDRIAEIVPTKVYNRANGEIALFTPSGGVLLDGKASEFDFTQSTIVTSSMSLAGGSLSGLTYNGNPVDLNSSPGYFDGGSLAANFEIRDTLIPGMDAQLDGLARDLIERFQDPLVDTTLLVGDAGLFTDAGLAFDPLNELGLAGRLSVNAAVDPAQGGVITNLRDGINAAAPGISGDNTILRNMLSAFVTPITPPATIGLVSALGGADLAAALTADISQQSVLQEEQFAYIAAERSVLRTSELDYIAVDTDDQMQQLIVVEQAYAANARIVSVIDDLMQTLLNL